MLRNELDVADVNIADTTAKDKFKLGVVAVGVEGLAVMGGVLLLGKYATIALAPCALFNLGCLDYVLATKERAIHAVKHLDRASIVAGVGVAAVTCGTMIAVGADKMIADVISSDKTHEVLARVAGVAAGITVSAAAGALTSGLGLFVANKVERDYCAEQNRAERVPLIVHAS